MLLSSHQLLYHSVNALFIVGISAQKAVVAIIDHATEDTEEQSSSSLRGFKPSYVEKLYWEQQSSGYQHWNPNPNPNGQGQGQDGRDREAAASDYSMTLKELIDTAIASNEAATAAKEVADASVAIDYEAVREAVGKLNSAAYHANEEAVLACAYLPTVQEEETLDSEDDEKVINLLQDITHVEGIANAIAEAAKRTAENAERAVEAIQAASPVRNVISSTVSATKSQADTVVTMVQQLNFMMIGNAGGGPEESE